MRGLFKLAAIMVMVLFMTGEIFAFEKALLKGHVMDIYGNVVTGAEIFVYRTPDTRRPADFISAGTNAEGMFLISLPARKYWVVARLKKGEKYGPLMPGDRHSGEPVEVDFSEAGELLRNFIVMDIMDAARTMKKIRQDYIKIEGRIKDKNGIPVQGVYAFANNKEGVKEIPDYISGWTDGEGDYTLYLPAGKYFFGYAEEIPMVLHNKVLRELSFENSLKGIDIIAYSLKKTSSKDEGAGGMK